MSKRVPLGNLRTLVFDRAADRCEAVFEYGNRCLNPADALHHRLPRGPGGNTCDMIAVTSLANGTFDPARHLAHLAALCEPCHTSVAHGEPARAVALGLRVLGQMRHERWSGQTFYQGPSPEFAALWPKEQAA